MGIFISIVFFGLINVCISRLNVCCEFVVIIICLVLVWMLCVFINVVSVECRIGSFLVVLYCKVWVWFVMVWVVVCVSFLVLNRLGDG